jgi:CRP/FNR family transcriptional regulator, cyclic AMP receptor protein
MTGPDRSAILREIDFFKGCTARQLEDIGHLSEERTLHPGETLCRQDDFESEVFVLLDGEASVIKDGDQVATVGAGEVVGELSMLGSGRRTATLRAATELRVLVMDPREIDSVLASDPSASERLGHREPN